jgi:hypothetical protein
MIKRDYFFFYLISLAIVVIVAAFQSSPGYMDADYYYAGGVQLAEGHGFQEEILWNYLDDPAGLPHPSHAYWMPLSSILAALGMKLAGRPSFNMAQLGFVLLAALVPPLTARLAYVITRQRRMALLAGLLAIFPGFYLPYLSTSDAFGLYMVLGTLFLLAIPQEIHFVNAFILGIIAGLMHLTRADGLLWLFLAAIVLLLMSPKSKDQSGSWRRLVALCLCGFGYLITMEPWILRNLSAFGTLFSPGGTHALWITSYNELFIYPASLLTPTRWWSAGLSEILKARLWAAGQNFQTTLAVEGEIFLLPLVIIGCWRWRRDIRVKTGVIAWALTFVAMTFIFPFQGSRGGMFHSGAAIQPLFWAVAPSGLEALVGWVGRLRRWNISQAQRFFQAGLILLSLLLTGMLTCRRVVGENFSEFAWNAPYIHYTQLERFITTLGASPGDIVMVNNSPGYFAANGRPAISIPYGDVDTLLETASRYRGRYLLLEFNQLQGDDNLYIDPEIRRTGLRYLGSFEDTRIFQIISGGQ